jgi:hypothetical protein
LAGGWPFYVQMAAALLWQDEDLTRAAATWKIQAEPRLRELWHGLSEVEQEMLQQLENRDATLVEQLQRYGVILANGSLFSKVFSVRVRKEK